MNISMTFKVGKEINPEEIVCWYSQEKKKLSGAPSKHLTLKPDAIYYVASSKIPSPLNVEGFVGDCVS